jgi:hypothetical protein
MTRRLCAVFASIILVGLGLGLVELVASERLSRGEAIAAVAAAAILIAAALAALRASSARISSR